MFIKTWAEQKASLPNDQINRKIWDILLDCPRFPELQLNGEHVSLSTFCSILQVSDSRVTRLRKAMLEGWSAPPEDQRKTPRSIDH
eukprot:6725986-Karenia_brevis.AAC.1